MSRIATCGNCQERVTVPEGLEEGESVRCPLCQAVYSLSEVPTEATDADDDSETPPELVPVAEISEEGQESESSRVGPEASEHQAVETAEANGQPEESPEADTSEGLEISDEEDTAEAPSDEIGKGTDEAIEEPDAEAEAGVEPGEEEPTAETEADTGEEGEEREEEGAEEAAESAEDATETGEEPSEAAAPDETVQVRCPHCDAEYPLSQVVVVTTGAELGPAMAAAVARYVLPGEGPAGEAPALDVWAKADGVPQIDVGEGAQPQAVTAHAGAFDFAREDAEAEAGPASVASRRPRRRNQKSMAREMAGWVFGGVAGLVIAYYLLNFIRGEAGNFLKIPLPCVSHTYRYSPDWFPGWMKAAPESEEGASEEEIADLDEIFRPAQREAAGGSERPAPALDQTESAGNLFSDGPSSGLGGAAPPPEQKTLPDGYVGLAAPPSYSSDELGEALKATHESVGEEAEPISEEAYGKWCRLAEVVTFAQGAPGAGQLRDRKSAVRALLEKVGENEANLDKIGFQAGALCVARRRPSNGILLAGKVTNIVSEGNAHGAHVELAASGRTILVAGKRPLPAKEGESVLILGRIVDNPAENLIGFKTQQPLVVWAGLTVKVEP